MGSDEDGGSTSPESAEGTDTPDVVADLGASCVRFVERALGVRLDFTQDTLPVLDHYLRTAEGTRDEVLGLVVPAAGAYFGEVLRRHIPSAMWEKATGDYEEYRMIVTPGPLRFNPIGIVLEAVLAQATTDAGADLDIPAHARDVVHAAVARMGEVKESDFFTLAIRFEVIEQIHTTLLGLATAR